MNKKTWEVLGAILILVIFIIVLVIALSTSKEPQPDDVGISDTVPEVIFPDVPVATGDPVIMPNPVARAFVERFGSFSTESDYANIEDVMALATSGLQSRLQGIIAEARRTAGSAYYGVSTRVIAMEVVEETETSASLRITTQRQESIDSPANTTSSYKEIDVKLVREGDTWLVNDFSWQ